MYLLYVNGKIPLDFADGKEYNVGTGYLALTQNEDNSVLLCRLIPEQERQQRKKWKEEQSGIRGKSQGHYVVDLKYGRRDVAILCEVDNMEQADQTVRQYKEAWEKHLD